MKVEDVERARQEDLDRLAPPEFKPSWKDYLLGLLAASTALPVLGILLGAFSFKGGPRR